MIFDTIRFETLLLILTLLTGCVTLAHYLYKKLIAQPAVVGSSDQPKENWVIEYCRSFFPVFLLVLVLRSFFFEAFRIPSGSMIPTLLVGDFIIVNKFDYGIRLPVSGKKIIPIGNPKTGDIIIFKHPSGKDLIKRVVGMPGDHIRYANKKLYINDKEVPTEIVAENDNFVEKKESLPNVDHNIYVYPNRFMIYPFHDVIVPQNNYFVMGDNRDNSEDSRFWGFVPDKDILGRAVATWLSMDGWTKVRWERFGKSVYNYNDENG